MRSKSFMPVLQEGAISRELLTLLDADNAQLTICQLADKMLVSRKVALLLLVTLESHGVVTWNENARIYRPHPESLRLLLYGEGKSRAKSRRASTPQAPLMARAARIENLQRSSNEQPRPPVNAIA